MKHALSINSRSRDCLAQLMPKSPMEEIEVGLANLAFLDRKGRSCPCSKRRKSTQFEVNGFAIRTCGDEFPHQLLDLWSG
jgi:hypothetical protein